MMPYRVELVLQAMANAVFNKGINGVGAFVPNAYTSSEIQVYSRIFGGFVARDACFGPVTSMVAELMTDGFPQWYGYDVFLGKNPYVGGIIARDGAAMPIVAFYSGPDEAAQKVSLIIARAGIQAIGINDWPSE
jgi:hypothetical protein